MRYKELIKKLNKKQIPRHVAVIMDGNGRWALSKGTIRLNGHKHGKESVRRLLEVAYECGVKVLTIYAFSTENWRRSDFEVKGLLKLILNSLLEEIDSMHEQNINVKFIGSSERLIQVI